MRAFILAAGILAAGLLAWSAAAEAGTADVVAAEAAREGGGRWRFSVTVAHDDSGWEHYADRWEVVAPDGSVLGTRILAHPHENEQPFTRSLGGVAIPPEIDRVTVRAYDSKHGGGGREVSVTLPR